MSKYTTELRHLINNHYDIGLADYPIFDETYRAALNAKIIQHYLLCEIGAETPGRFKIYLNRTMAEIMPYYNQLYRSAALAINPLVNFDLAETTSRENSGASLAASENKTALQDDNLSVQSNTPASLLSVPDIKANVYASEAARGDHTAESSGSTTSSTSGSALELFTRKLTGGSGVNQSDALLKFRKTFINIDMMVINDLATCFMGVW